MAVTDGKAIRTIADIIKVAMKCSDSEANQAELEVCKSPASVAKLLTACGISTASVGYGGKLFVAGAATGGATSVVGVALGAAGILGAKRFCTAAVKFGAQSINSSNLP